MKRNIYVSEVKSGIAIPPINCENRGGGTFAGIYPFAMMEVGDMFITDGPQINQQAKNWAIRRGLKWKFCVRFLGQGGRSGVWRTE